MGRAVKLVGLAVMAAGCLILFAIAVRFGAPVVWALIGEAEPQDFGSQVAAPLSWLLVLLALGVIAAPAVTALCALGGFSAELTRPWPRCPSCGAPRRSLAAVDRHARRAHGVSIKALVEPGLACDRCRRAFRDAEALRQHRRDRHGVLAP